jgi:pyruvate dehydrogenase E2 component (dihydrolipoamide acetyltransferase)
MAARELLLPDLGEGLEDAEIVEWRVAVGDSIAVDQTLVEVETAKANVEIPCPWAGAVVALHGAPGARVPVGSPLATIEVAAAEVSEDAPVAASPEGVGEAPPRPLVGYGAVAPGDAAPRALAAPPVRKRARELGVDLALVAATGPGGVVSQRDLDRHLDRKAAPTALDAAPGRTVAVRGVRRTIAEKMVTSRREIPDASTWVQCDATDLLSARAAINARQHDVLVTPLALVLRACAAGLARYPRVNARYHSDREEIEELGAVHLGVATQTERGLVVPVIRDAHTRTTLELARELGRLADGAREQTLTPAELVGSTFTVSNYGVFGVDGGVAIINHPEVAILGVGRFTEKPWVADGELAVRTIVELSLSFDHRVMDGADAGGFLRFIADCVEQPAMLLAHS